MMAILCTDGQLNYRSLQDECVKGSWIPLLVYQKINENHIYLPVFSIEDTAKDFIKRNLPKQWTHAGINLSNKDIEIICNKGWKIEHYRFPRKLAGLSDIKLGFEIHEFHEQPDYLVSKF